MLPDSVVIIRLLLATVLSALVGVERELHGRAAGLRTHILVGVGSTLIMITSLHLAEAYMGRVNADPGRIAAQVVSGIGFLGAGTILRFRASVRGLTTAASLWAVAGIGLAVGTGLYFPATVTTAIILGALLVLTKVEHSILRKDWYKILIIETRGEIKQLEEIRAMLSDYNVEIRDMEIRRVPDSKNIVYEMNLKLLTNREDDNIMSDLVNVEGVIRSSWR